MNDEPTSQPLSSSSAAAAAATAARLGLRGGGERTLPALEPVEALAHVKIPWSPAVRIEQCFSVSCSHAGHNMCIVIKYIPSAFILRITLTHLLIPLYFFIIIDVVVW